MTLVCLTASQVVKTPDRPGTQMREVSRQLFLTVSRAGRKVIVQGGDLFCDVLTLEQTLPPLGAPED